MTGIEKLQEKMNIGDGAVICDEYNRRYFTGFESSNGVLAVTKTDAVFFTDFRYIEAAKNSISTAEVRILEASHSAAVISVFEKEEIKKVYFEAEAPYSYCSAMQKAMPAYEFVPGDDIFASLRAQKTPEELDCIKRSQAITDKGYAYILEFVRENYKKGLSEKDVAFELEFFLRKNGSGKMPFDIICASGENTSRPHAGPSDKIIEKGDFVTLDFGSSYNGYASDMTRTFAVGEVSDEQRRIYGLVLKAQLDAMKQIKAGVRGCDIDAVARNLFAEHGVAEAFGHSLGHSLGLFIHESPNFSPKYTGIIPENAVLSDEPGLYFEGKFGVRIEDIVHVMKDGCESLTHSPKNLIIVQ